MLSSLFTFVNGNAKEKKMEIEIKDKTKTKRGNPNKKEQPNITGINWPINPQYSPYEYIRLWVMENLKYFCMRASRKPFRLEDLYFQKSQCNFLELYNYKGHKKW